MLHKQYSQKLVENLALVRIARVLALDALRALTRRNTVENDVDPRILQPRLVQELAEILVCAGVEEVRVTADDDGVAG